MKTKHRKHGRNNDGVALIIVLGLLSVLTLLAVAFAIAMRVERMIARNYLNGIKATHIVQTGIVRAMADANNSLVGMCYPNWSTRSTTSELNAMCSTGSVPCPDILSGEASRTIPGALQIPAENVVPYCMWVDIPFAGETSRVAYVVVNVSGLLDANLVGGAPRVWSTNASELNLTNFADLQSGQEEEFYNQRAEHRRYETSTELDALNTAVDTVSNLFVFSWDPDPDEVFLTTDAGNWWEKIDTATPPGKMGQRDAILHSKFRINDIVNYTCWNNDPDFLKYKNNGPFMNEYYTPIVYLLGPFGAGVERPTDVIWNIVNWLDSDRIPQGGDANPWAHTEGGEPVPLISEIVLTNRPGTTNEYEIVVEIWFPYDPVIVAPLDGFYLEIGAYSKQPSVDINRQTVLGLAAGGLDWSTTNDITDMEWDTATEFLCFTSSLITFADAGPIGRVTNGVTNAVWFEAMVGQEIFSGSPGRYPVDLGAGPGSGGGYAANYQFCEYKAVGSWSVDDPRTNGKWGDWDDAPQTLGSINDISVCKPYKWVGPEGDGMRAGLPMYCKNGLMRTKGELGFIFRSNVILGEPGTWQTIDLMSSDRGAYLLDCITMRTNSTPAHGLVNINTRQKETLRTLFRHMPIGYTTAAHPNMKELDNDDVEDIVDAIIANRPADGWTDFQHMFEKAVPNAGGPLAAAFRNAASNSFAEEGYNPLPVNDKVREDPLRHIVDMITFRQNILLMIVAAQVLGGDGFPVAEKRAVATVYRDSYTSKYFIRSVKWLDD